MNGSTSEPVGLRLRAPLTASSRIMHSDFNARSLPTGSCIALDLGIEAAKRTIVGGLKKQVGCSIVAGVGAINPVSVSASRDVSFKPAPPE